MNNFDDLKIPEEDEHMITEAQHEKEMTRMEAVNKRWFIAFLVVLTMLFATNAGWIIYESQFEDISVTNSAETGDNSNVQVLGTGTGDLYYGTGNADD